MKSGPFDDSSHLVSVVLTGSQEESKKSNVKILTYTSSVSLLLNNEQ